MNPNIKKTTKKLIYKNLWELLELSPQFIDKISHQNINEYKNESGFFNCFFM
jgi:hypothetical protein